MKEKNNLAKGIGYFILAILLIVIYKVLDNFSDIANWLSGLLKTLMHFLWVY